MEELTVKLKWDKELGKCWMNADNLKLCLFTSDHTKKELLEVETVGKLKSERGNRKNKILSKE